MAVQVTIRDLTSKVEAGWKKDALAAHYGLPKIQMANLLRDAGLRIRKFHAPKYELVDDTVPTDVEDIDETTLGIEEEVVYHIEVEETPVAATTVVETATPSAETW